MVVIHLYGVLESVAQRTVRLHVESFDEAMRALMANFPKLRGVLQSINVSVLVNEEMMTFEDCLRPMHADRIDLMPAIGGAGPAIFILAGAALMAGAETLAGLAGGTLLGSFLTTAAIAQFGLAMIIGGISQLLFKPPKPSLGQKADNIASYNFNGAVNTIQQGLPVPVGYGRLRVGSMVISSNVQTWDIPIGPSTVAPGPAPGGAPGGRPIVPLPE